MGRASRRSERDYLAIVSVTITAAFLLCTALFAVTMVLVQRDHVAAERAAAPGGAYMRAYKRANEICEENRLPLATGWTLSWDAGADTYVCVYDRNDRRIGRSLSVSREDS